jgi:hypothetical protein
VVVATIARNHSGDIYMSQRNPMNERYQGDGPGGKTRKSATSLKPKLQAASSVHIEAKPTNRQERKAAAKRREAELRRKEEERARKAEEREQKAMIAAGMVPPVPKKPSLLDRLFPKRPAAPAGSQGTGVSASQTQSSARRSAFPTSKRYKDLRKVYWVLLISGVTFVIITFIVQMNYNERMDIWGVTMAIAYASIIAALILDFSKIRPLVKAHQAEMRGATGKSSPKQIKHAEEAAERARQIEEFNKRKKQARAQKRRELLGLAPKSDAGDEPSDELDGESDGESDGEPDNATDTTV